MSKNINITWSKPTPIAEYNWKGIRYVGVLEKDGKSFSFKFTLGLGHVKHPGIVPSGKEYGYKDGEFKQVFNAYERNPSARIKDKNLATAYATACAVKQKVYPDKVTVLNCLASDADAHNYSFEDWACDCGYDDDSIRAKKMYDDCVETYFKLIEVGLTDNDIESLREQ